MDLLIFPTITIAIVCITRINKAASVSFGLLIRYIRSVNRQNLTYKLSPNHMVDTTDAEYDAHKGESVHPGTWIPLSVQRSLH